MTLFKKFGREQSIGESDHEEELIKLINLLREQLSRVFLKRDYFGMELMLKH